MLQSSRTWPSILTMAVVQLKFDQKGKYSYSTIANINQSHKQQLIENHIPITNNGNSDCKSEPPANGGHKRDLITRKNVSKSRSLSSTTLNGRPQNGFQHHHNGNSLSCANSAPGKNGKVCLCELEFRDNRDKNRKRSESIQVDNWDYIFKEKAIQANLELPDDERNAVPK